MLYVAFVRGAPDVALLTCRTTRREVNVWGPVVTHCIYNQDQLDRLFTWNSSVDANGVSVNAGAPSYLLA